MTGLDRRLAVEIGTAIAVAIAALAWVGWFSIDLASPLKIHGDYALTTFNVKSLLDYGTIYHNPAVAFPEQGDYYAFPTPDIIQYAIIRFIGLFNPDPIAVLNLFNIVCCLTAAFSTYLALRFTAVSQLIAACSALIFAVCAFMCVRAPLHPYLCFTAAIPWICRFCVLLPLQGARLSSSPLRLSLLSSAPLGVIAGSCGLYYAFFTCLFLSAALAVTYANHRTKASLKPGLIFGAALLAIFFFWLLPNLWAVIESGIALPKRDYFEQTIYSLRFPDLFIPPLPPFLHAYQAFAAKQEVLSAEGNYSILGLWGIVGLLAGIIVCLSAIIGRSKQTSPCRRLFAAKLTTLYVALAIIFAMPYGLGFIFNMYVNATIRAQTRIGIFILAFALFLTAFLLEHVKRCALRQGKMIYFYAALITLLAATVAPTFHFIARTQQASAAEWTTRRGSYENVLDAMNRNHLQAIAQYPAYVYPEGPQYPGFGNTEHFWPYLVDRSHDRHWSFGAAASQPIWQMLGIISQWPTGEFFTALRCLDYDAVLIEKRALPPQQAILFQEHIHKFGMNHVVIADPERILLEIGKTPISLETCEKTSALRANIASSTGEAGN